MSRGVPHYCPSEARDKGSLLKEANPLRMNFDGTKVLCGFDCKRVATQMTPRLRLNKQGDFEEVQIPWCGVC
jgi:hypothetical protein